MNRVRLSITTVSLAFLVAACGSSEPEQQTTQPGTGGNGGAKSSNSDKTSSGGKQSTTSKAASGKGGNAATSKASDGGASEGGEGSSEGGSASGGASSGPKTASSATKGGGSSAGGKSGSAPASSAAGGNKTSGTVSGGSSAQGGQAAGGTNATTTFTVAEPTLVTSAKDAYWKVGSVTEVTSNATVTVNDGSAKQTWDGFGGTFNEKGWYYLQMLSAADREKALKLLFDAADGANFVYGRIPIGASDYAMDRYTLNDNAGDTTMSKFSIEKDKTYLIPYIKAALGVKSNLHLWGSPWTPPPWMKNNNAYDKGQMKDDSFPAFALYLAKFVEEYGKEGMTIEAIHPQNEPGYFDNPYPCCKWTADQMKTFIGKHLGPTFEERGVKAQIWIGTMSAPEDGSVILPAVLGDAASMKYVKGAGLQWNTSGSVSSARNKGISVMQTEHKCGNYNWNPAGAPAYNPNQAPNDHAYAKESWGNIKDWINAGVNSYSAWNMVLDTIGMNMNKEKPWPQNSLLTVDTSAKKLNITPAYYVFRHLSQYVDPGAKVVGTSSGDALAFKNPDGTIVFVMYTANAGKQVVGIGSKKLQFDAPADGWTTVNWKG